MSSEISDCECEISLKDAVEFIVDNRGRTAPTEPVGIALIATNCVNNQDLYPRKLNLRYVSQETYNTWFRSHPKPGDILLTNKGSQNGAICLVPDPVDFCIAQDMVALRADSRKISPLYLFAALRSGMVQKRIKALNVDAVIPHLKKTDFNKLLIPLPERTLQDSVGELYFELSSRVELLRETNATLEAIAQALFKSWFVDFDPVHAKQQGLTPAGMAEATAALFPDSFEESPLGLVPKGWRAGAIDSLASLNPESWSAKQHPERIHYIDLANTKANQIDGITEFSFDDAPSRARRVVRRGDVIVGTVRPGNRSFARIAQDVAGLTGSTGFAVLRAQQEFDQALVYIAATRDEAIDRLAHLADGGAYPAVRPEVVASTPLAIPPKEIRIAFGEVANALFASVGGNQERARLLAELRDTLLPRLISGQLRLPEATAQMEEAAA